MMTLHPPNVEARDVQPLVAPGTLPFLLISQLPMLIPDFVDLVAIVVLPTIALSLKLTETSNLRSRLGRLVLNLQHIPNFHA